MKFKYVWYVVIDPRVMLRAQNILVQYSYSVAFLLHGKNNSLN